MRCYDGDKELKSDNLIVKLNEITKCNVTTLLKRNNYRNKINEITVKGCQVL